MSNTDTNTAPLSVRDRIIDTEDDNPNVGVVVWNPSEMTIAEWEFQTNDGEMTVAETNPEKIIGIAGITPYNGR